MEYRILGRTGIKVSTIGVGGVGLEKVSPEVCEEIIDCAFSQGVNYLDIYNANPVVRSGVGNALKKYKREDFVIEGHLCTIWDKNQYRRTRKLDEVKEAYQDLLDRLQVSYVDVGMIHYVDKEAEFDLVVSEGILDYAKELKEKGVIRSIGISTHNPDIALKAVEEGDFDVILFSINPAYDMLPASDDLTVLKSEDSYKDRAYEGIDPKRAGLYQLCQNKGIALNVMKGYGAGVLLSDEQSPFGKALTPIQCLHYALTRPGVASVAIGFKNTEEVLAATAYDGALKEEKDYGSVLANTPRSAFSGHCMYCGHCAPCAKDIDVASVNKYLDLAATQSRVPDTLRNHYEVLEHHASDCIECGSCMRNCPFGVDVIGKMREAKELFGY